MLKLVGIFGFTGSDYVKVQCHDENAQLIKQLTGDWHKLKEDIFDNTCWLTTFHDLRGENEHIKDMIIWSRKRAEELAKTQKEAI